jgi:hypothetical protein
MRVMAKHPDHKLGYCCARSMVVPPLELQHIVFTFVDKAKINMKTLIANEVCRPTSMGCITMLKHLRVVILQEIADMIIAGSTQYLFLHPVFVCELFKDFIIVTRLALKTAEEEENSYDVFGEALDNTIDNFHHTLDAGLNIWHLTSTLQRRQSWIVNLTKEVLKRKFAEICSVSLNYVLQFFTDMIVCVVKLFILIESKVFL